MKKIEESISMKKSLTFKLVACAALLLFSILAVVGGVWAAQSVSINTTGNITFAATNVYAKVSGSTSGAQSDKTFDDLLYSASSVDGAPVSGNASTWTGNDLAFQTTGEDITITVTVENLSTERQLYVKLSDNMVGTASNLKKTVSPSVGIVQTLEKSSAEETTKITYTITFHIENQALSIQGDFNYVFELTDGSQPKPEDDKSISYFSSDWKTNSELLSAVDNDVTNIKEIKFTSAPDDIPEGATAISVGASSASVAQLKNNLLLPTVSALDAKAKEISTYKTTVTDVTAYVSNNDDSTYNVLFYSADEIYAQENSSSLFSGLTNLETISFSNFNTSEVTNVDSMFEDCSSLTSLNMGNFDLSNVSSAEDMLSGCSTLTSISSPAVLSTEAEITLPETTVWKDSKGETQTTITEPATSVTGSLIYTITFDANGGEASSTSMTVVDGNTYAQLPTATRENYTFKGWYTAATGGTKITVDSVATGSITLYAQWERIVYAITLNPGEGTVSPTTVNVNAGDAYGTLPTATRTNYTFKGWYTAATGGTKVETTGVPTGNATIYAQWERIVYTITFNANGGTASKTTMTVNAGDAYGELPTATKQSSTFQGWFTAATGGTKVTESTVPSGSITLYAQWQKVVYTITLDANGGTVSKSSISVDGGCAYGELPTPTRANYNFLGWFDGKTTGSQQVTASTIATQSTTIYAQWYSTITLNANGGAFSGGATTQTQTVFASDSYSTLPIPTRSDYSFKGWYTAATGGTKVTESTVPTGNTTLYAHWSDAIFTTDSNGTITGLTTYGKTLSVIEIPNQIGDETITAIGENAFKNNTTMTSVTIPDGITSIGNRAFYYCTYLTEVNYNAKSLTTNYSWVFYNAGTSGTGITITFGESVEKIPAYLFSAEINVREINISSAVTSIGNYAFRGCVTSTIIPSSVTSVGSYVFANGTLVYYCGEKSNVTCGDSDKATWCYYSESEPTTSGDFWHYVAGVPTVWPTDVFTTSGNSITGLTGYGKSLSSIEIPKSINGTTITEIAYYAFECCYNMTNVTFAEDSQLTSIRSSAFCRCTGLTSIIIPEGVTLIESRAFDTCTGLTSVTIPSSVTSIGDYAFYWCYRLTEINFNATSCTDLTSSSHVFTEDVGRDGTGLTITFGEGVTKIPAYLFAVGDGYYDHSHISKLIISSTIQSIGNYAFQDCQNSILIYYNGSESDKSAMTIKSSAFSEYCSATWCYYSESEPTTSGDFWHYVNEIPTVWPAADIFTTNGTGTITGLTGYGKTLTTVEIPSIIGSETITAIGSRAFFGNKILINITISDSVTSIENFAFYRCSNLTTVKFADGSQLASIGNYAFRYCRSLVSITIPSSVTSISTGALDHCTGLASITIPSFVTSIDTYVFSGCTSLTKIYIPSSVTIISADGWYNSPFCNCSSTLKIYCGASSKPSGWGTYWNYYDSDNNLSVIWGVTPEEFAALGD